MTVTYFIQHGGIENSPIKIGKATTLEHRTRALRDFPNGMVVLGYLEGDEESRIHERFKHRRLALEDGGREWFKPCSEIAEFILRNCTVCDAAAIRALTRQPITEGNVPTSKMEDFLCTHHWTIGQINEWDLFNLLSVKHQCKESRQIGPSEEDGDDEEEEIWNGPSTDCEACCLWWGLDGLFANVDFIETIGIHEERRELWVFLKPATSRRRRDLIEGECVDYFSAIHSAGWWLYGMTSLEWPPSKQVTIAWNKLFIEMLEERRFRGLALTDAVVDWVDTQIRRGNIDRKVIEVRKAPLTPDSG